ncbi:transposase [Candidatus Sarmatiella mevalonica]|uniref:transposase n=1 Tax=Candidatus Sarmatiella mevalonica TaxID=2770581 RepID=UPI0019211740|nr:transposase [Candidatus Sarmatiella mevalonica]
MSEFRKRSIIKTGCQWRMLAKDFPTYLTVYSFYRRCRIKDIWEKLMRDLMDKGRIAQGRNPNPSYSFIDSQSVKTTSAFEKRGIDGKKR